MKPGRMLRGSLTVVPPARSPRKRCLGRFACRPLGTRHLVAKAIATGGVFGRESLCMRSRVVSARRTREQLAVRGAHDWKSTGYVIDLHTVLCTPPRNMGTGPTKSPHAHGGAFEVQSSPSQNSENALSCGGPRTPAPDAGGRAQRAALGHRRRRPDRILRTVPAPEGPLTDTAQR